MSPLIPAIIGGSMVKLLAMILEMSGVLTKGSPTLTILNVIGDGAFFFLPLMVAASAAIKFKTNMSLAIAIAGVLLSLIHIFHAQVNQLAVEVDTFAVEDLEFLSLIHI